MQTMSARLIAIVLCQCYFLTITRGEGEFQGDKNGMVNFKSTLVSSSEEYAQGNDISTKRALSDQDCELYGGVNLTTFTMKRANEDQYFLN